jgi:Family of unknown function (DUF6788)
MSKPGSRDAERYETLKNEVAAVGLIRRGSLVRRLVACGKPNCCCQADPPQLHGPYYQWTRKVAGKTVTVRVNKAEAKLLTKWIANGRRLSKIVARLERISHRLTERQLRELPKP